MIIFPVQCNVRIRNACERSQGTLRQYTYLAIISCCLNDTQSTGTISTLFLTYNFGIQGALTAKIAQNWHSWRCHQHGVHV